MTITIPDDVLKQAGLTERQALIEFACRLFDAGKLDFHTAGRLAGLSRVEFESELMSRKIDVYRPTEGEFESDLRTLAELEN
jgi:predicted HTH domain antitoxin